MKKSIVVVLSLFFFIPLYAFQETKPDTAAPLPLPPGPWKHSLVGALTFTQVSHTNWAQGGQNALAYAVSADGKTELDVSKLNWAHTYKLAFGQTRLSGQGLRKTDDKIDLQSVFTYKFGLHVNPYAGATMKTQFTKGVQYDAAGNETVVSKFFDPAYLTQSIGIGYQPIPQVKTRLGAALREIITSKFVGYADDPATTVVERIKTDGGLESITEVEWKIEEQVLFTSKIELFSPFKRYRDFSLRSDNTLAVQVSKYFIVKVNAQVINDKKVNPRTQVKETLAFGVSYTVL
ncbi:MAG: DUF3078 domain-containing protein [Ignavibacteriae bacterium]|nr:DUF3078 domain-containing protein [Ignavibacteriota bacterium]